MCRGAYQLSFQAISWIYPWLSVLYRAFWRLSDLPERPTRFRMAGSCVYRMAFPKEAVSAKEHWGHPNQKGDETCHFHLLAFGETGKLTTPPVGSSCKRWLSSSTRSLASYGD
jgi:hypothetical protein